MASLAAGRGYSWGMTLPQLLVVHVRMVALLSQAWRMHHELDDVEDFLDTLNGPYLHNPFF